MPFADTVKSGLRPLLVQIVKDWPDGDVYNLCCGNLTMENLFRYRPGLRFHSCDVTLYSAAIGFYAAGSRLDFDLKPGIRDEFPWLPDYLDTDKDRLATILLLYEWGTFLLRKDRLGYDRYAKGIMLQWPAMHAKTLATIDKAVPRIVEYHSGDALTYIDEIPRNAMIMTYPPFAHSETFFGERSSKIEEFFDWDAPTYTTLDHRAFMDYVQKVMQFDYWTIGHNSDEPIGILAPYTCMHYQSRNRGQIIRIYSDSPARAVILPHRTLEPLAVPRLSPGDRIGEYMIVIKLSSAQFRSLRSEYLNKYIRPSDPDLPIAVLVDGQLIGAFAMSMNRYDRMKDSVYMLSDFPVAPTDYPRLSKLVLYAALSHEAKLLCDRMNKTNPVRRHRVYTTAFSQHPVSMKYRGLFTVFNRKENEVDPADHSAQKYQINYMSDLGRWSLDEGLKQWKKQHGKIKTYNESNSESNTSTPTTS
jgi:hypothetical protein